MKILLANSYFLERDANEQKIMKPYAPLGMLYVTAMLKRAGHDVHVFDGTFLSPPDFRRRIVELEPDLAGIYANVITREISLGFVRETRELGVPVIVGGPDPTSDPAEYLAAGARAVVRGEGEHTVLDLAAHFEKNGPDEDLTGVPGLALRRNGDLFLTADRERIDNLDELPLPDRSAVDMEWYVQAWKRRHGYSSLSLITSRGCPYSCTWCSKAIFGGSFRQRSPHGVVEEMQFLIDSFGPDQLWFADDVLTLNRNWILEFARAVEERKLATRFECLARVDRVDEEVLDALKRAGCMRIWYGAESGSEKMLEAMQKGFTVRKVRESVVATMKRKIEAGLFILIGYPGEKFFDLLKTLKMIRELRPDFCGSSVAFPILGTPFYDEVRHLLSPDYAWSRRNENRLSFKGRYPPLFYWFAVRLVHNWASYYSVRNRRAPLRRRLTHALKFLVAGVGTAVVGLLYDLKQTIHPARSRRSC